MEMGLALVAEQIIPINHGDYVGLELTANHEVVPGSAGKDIYCFNGMILSGKIIAATGREKKYNWTTIPFGLGPVEAEPPHIIPVQFEEYTRWRLIIKTNIILDLALVVVQWGLRWLDAGGRLLLDLPFRSPEVTVDCPGRGQFVVDITPFIRRVYSEKVTT